MTSLLLLVVLSANEPFVRTTTDDSSKSHCLYWKADTLIEWRLNANGNPETPGETEHDALAKAFATWQAQFDACGSLRFKEGPRTATALEGFFRDGNDENVVMFRQDVCKAPKVPTNDPCLKDGSCGNKYDCWDYTSAALAITTTSFEPASGKILDADIEFNTPNFTFTTVDAPPCVGVFNFSCVASDIQNTATHEIGHMIGLSHSGAMSSTMFASASPGELNKRTLDDGSKNFVCLNYPKGKASLDCRIFPVSSTLGNVGAGCSSTEGTPGVGFSILALASLLLLRKRTNG